ncbi:MAG: group II intron reverse transcriptase/maturase, partial [Actinobacteria bacterium]|nr:group II intron reverse transcriptase/maturase [Actinomycetota bacterium]
YILTGSNAGTARPGSPVLIRYADDLLAFCHSRQQTEQVKALLADWLAPRGLVFNEDKTCITRAPRAQRERGNVGRKPRPMCCCVEDEGLLALRRRPSGDGVKPPHAALAEDRRGER